MDPSRLLMAAAVVLTTILQVMGAAVYPPMFPVLNGANDFRMEYVSPAPMDAPVRIADTTTPFSDILGLTRLVTLAPCGVIAAHYHPRSYELAFVSKGAVQYQLYTEGGERVNVDVNRGQSVIAPQGTVHVVRNTACREAELFLQLDHPSPGAVFLGPAITAYPASYLADTFEGSAPVTMGGNTFAASECRCNEATTTDSDDLRVRRVSSRERRPRGDSA